MLIKALKNYVSNPLNLVSLSIYKTFLIHLILILVKKRIVLRTFGI